VVAAQNPIQQVLAVVLVAAVVERLQMQVVLALPVKVLLEAAVLAVGLLAAAQAAGAVQVRLEPLGVLAYLMLMALVVTVV
jgi:hypothetical protein